MSYIKDTKLAVCDCGTPIVKRLNSRKLEMLKYHKGKPVKIITEYTGNKSTVKCEKCKHIFTFTTNDVSKSLSYVVAVPDS